MRRKAKIAGLFSLYAVVSHDAVSASSPFLMSVVSFLQSLTSNAQVLIVIVDVVRFDPG